MTHMRDGAGLAFLASLIHDGVAGSHVGEEGSKRASHEDGHKGNCLGLVVVTKFTPLR